MSWPASPLQGCYRYSRDELLRLFAPAPAAAQKQEAAALWSEEPLKPILTVGVAFTHILGAQVNSRCSNKDWQRDSSKQQKSAFLPGPEDTERISANLPRKEVRPLRVVLSDGSRNVPEDFRPSGTEVATVHFNPNAKPWVAADTKTAKYHVSLLQEKARAGDPFAAVLMESGVSDARGFLSIPVYSPAHQKRWYYRDPQGCTQGPFSSVDMFNWSAAGYFSQDLLVGNGRAPLTTLGALALRNRKDSETATAHLKSLLGLSASHYSR